MAKNDIGIPILDRVNFPTVGRYAAGGLIGGAGLAAALNLAQMLKEISEEKKKKEDPLETDEGTIVLTLPPKKGEDLSETGVCGCDPKVGKNMDVTEEDREPKVKIKKDSSKVTVRDTTTSKRQPRHYDGKYGKSLSKKANWQTLAASLLAMGGGGALGYSLVDKIYEIKKMKEKEEELARAKSEYLDKLQNKTAGDEPTFGKFDYPLAAAALALLLGSGGTAYLTKRVLDEYRKEPEIEKPKHVKRIVFKTAEDKVADIEDEKTAEIVSALTGIYMDICSGQPTILGEPKVAFAMQQLGTSAEEIYKQASYEDDYYSLVATLDKNPDFRKLLQRMSMEKHPVLKYFKWSVGLPIIRGIADKKLYSEVEKQYGPDSLKPKVDTPKEAAMEVGADAILEKTARSGGGLKAKLPDEGTPEWEKIRTFAKSKNRTSDEAIRKSHGDAYLKKYKQHFKLDDKTAEEEKQAFLPNISDIASSYTGSSIAEHALKRQEKEEEEEEEANKDITAEDILGQLEIASADPESAEFIQNNAEKIKKVLQLLAEQGKL